MSTSRMHSSSASTHILQVIALPLRILTEYFSATRSHWGHSAITPHSASLQTDRLFLLKRWHLPLLRLFQRLRHLLFPAFSFRCGQKISVTKPNIQKCMYSLTWERDLFCFSLSWATNTHKGGDRICCRQSSGMMDCGMSRKSGPTTADSNAKCLLTSLNSHPAHEGAAN